MSNTLTTYQFPTMIHFGPGSRSRLASVLKGQGCSRPLIVTDQNLAKLPFIQQIQNDLKRNQLDSSLFSGIFGNPTFLQFQKGLESFRSHQADSVVAIGGGAPVDVAKTIALMATNPGKLLDYEDGNPQARAVTQPLPFLVAIPTTAGTGSEVGRASVLSDDQTHEKKIIFAPALLPKVVLADPELHLELPPSITASTGMDALTHLIEAFLAKGSHPICEGIALEGIHLVAQSLVPAFEYASQKSSDPKHLEARSHMLNASMMGAIAFQKGLGVTHSCAHSLSTVCDLHHGLANGIMLPYAMKFNLEKEPHLAKRLCTAAGLPSPSSKSFVSWIIELQTKLQIPKTLSDLPSSTTISKDQIPSLVRFALQDGCHASNPRPVTEKDFHQLFTDAFEGTL